MAYIGVLGIYMDMRTITTIGLFLLLSCGQRNDTIVGDKSGQTQQIEEIELIFEHSKRIPNHLIEIKATNFSKKYEISVQSNPMNNDPEWSNTKIDTVYNLTEGQFNRLKEMVTAISTTDIIHGINSSGHDGTVWLLSFGNFPNKITYQFWTIDLDTKERGLEKYLETCEYIMMLGKLDIDKIK